MSRDCLSRVRYTQSRLTLLTIKLLRISVAVALVSFFILLNQERIQQFIFGKAVKDYVSLRSPREMYWIQAAGTLFKNMGGLNYV